MPLMASNRSTLRTYSCNVQGLAVSETFVTKQDRLPPTAVGEMRQEVKALRGFVVLSDGGQRARDGHQERSEYLPCDSFHSASCLRLLNTNSARTLHLIHMPQVPQLRRTGVQGKPFGKPCQARQAPSEALFGLLRRMYSLRLPGLVRGRLHSASSRSWLTTALSPRIILLCPVEACPSLTSGRGRGYVRIKFKVGLLDTYSPGLKSSS